jgi:hypothetical protein
MNSHPNSIARQATITFLCAFLLVGCAHSVKPWNRSDLVGCRWELDDPKQIQDFSFLDDGAILAVLGEKEGFMTMPTLDWKLTPKGVLVIKDDEGFRSTYRKIASDTNTATVIVSGKGHLWAKRQTWLKSKE